MDFDQLNQILKSGTREDLSAYCETHNLVIKDGKIFHKDPTEVKKAIEFWGKRQLVKKINLNS
jgi:hypothetical protein